ncbi:hypothetical protein [Enterococcus italicus]|uniref:hypothetical protein n=1 Tax=Enterococcus italicus TaxID=246144 RepID=UPI003F4689B0
MTSIYEVLGGNNKKDKKSNVLKSLFIVESRGSVVEIEAEPYDDAYNTNHIDDTMGKITRVLDRREKAIFKALSKEAGREIEVISITFFDDMSVCGGCTKVLGKKAVLVY